MLLLQSITGHLSNGTTLISIYNFLRRDQTMTANASPPSNRWIFGIILGIGVGIALTLSLDNVAVGIAVGVGVGVAMAAGLNRKKFPPSE
jgi:hypothetical protein